LVLFGDARMRRDGTVARRRLQPEAGKKEETYVYVQ